MARYIDADRLIKSLELSIKSWGRDCNSSAPIMMRAYQDAVYRVKNIPTADVVPKSEVAEIFQQIDTLIVEYFDGLYTTGEFLEIFNKLNKKYTGEQK